MAYSAGGGEGREMAKWLSAMSARLKIWSKRKISGGRTTRRHHAGMAGRSCAGGGERSGVIGMVNVVNIISAFASKNWRQAVESEKRRKISGEEIRKKGRKCGSRWWRQLCSASLRASALQQQAQNR